MPDLTTGPNRPTQLDIEPLVSGQSGIVAGRRLRTRAIVGDLFDDAVRWARLIPPRLARASRGANSAGSVHVIGIYSSELAPLMAKSVDELQRSRRDVRIRLGALDGKASALERHTVADGLRGKGRFENLNLLLGVDPPRDARWVIALDDDVELSAGFLDRFLFLAERFGFQLTEPALTQRSHAAWSVCRRERWTVARTTRFVEIGPVVAFHESVAGDLLPFPPQRMGWGVDLHWGGLALERGWRLGIVDAVAVHHRARQTASQYDRGDAMEEFAAFLAARPHIDRETALSVVERHYGWA